jgi:hypothetical protein
MNIQLNNEEEECKTGPVRGGRGRSSKEVKGE